jgi:hypothetical protein
MSVTFDFKQNVYLGFKLQTWPVSLSIDQTLSVSSIDIETAGEYAGSSHILEMGRHYEEYVRSHWGAPDFLPITGFPPGLPLRPLEMKARSAGVSGNIGETLAGIVASRVLGCPASEIAHLVVRSKQKTPDFLIHSSSGFQSFLEPIMPSSSTLTMPPWWLMESKTRSATINNDAVREGLRQLASVWYEMRVDEPEVVGFGVVVGSGLQKTRRIRIHFFLPQSDSHQQALISYLNSLTKVPDFTKPQLDSIVTFLA